MSRPTAKQMRQLWKLAEAYRDRYRVVNGGETIYQSDQAQFGALELAATMCKIVGDYKFPESE